MEDRFNHGLFHGNRVKALSSEYCILGTNNYIKLLSSCTTSKIPKGI